MTRIPYKSPQEQAKGIEFEGFRASMEFEDSGYVERLEAKVAELERQLAELKLKAAAAAVNTELPQDTD